jgi:small subunit ribosomal protein S16
MVKIRLRRVGAKKQASYRVVVADSRSPRDGRFIEVVGFYNPRTEPETVEINEDRALYWLNVGARPTEAVVRLLKNKGTLARLERLKQGESLEALVAEAEEAAQATPGVSPRTRLEPTEPVAEEPVEEQPAEEPVEEPEAVAADTEPAEAGDDGEEVEPEGEEA